jgi:hypothetical protein
VFRRIPWQDVCKFLAGAFFVNAGILFYLYLAGVSVRLLGTDFIETPEVSGVRSIMPCSSWVSSISVSFESGKAVQIVTNVRASRRNTAARPATFD